MCGRSGGAAHSPVSTAAAVNFGKVAGKRGIDVDVGKVPTVPHIPTNRAVKRNDFLGLGLGGRSNGFKGSSLFWADARDPVPRGVLDGGKVGGRNSMNSGLDSLQVWECAREGGFGRRCSPMLGGD